MKKPGKKKGGFLLWTLVFAALLVAADQVLLRVPLETAGLHEIQIFYRDFRQRLIALPAGGEKKTAASPTTKEQPAKPAPPVKATPPAATALPPVEKAPTRAVPPPAKTAPATNRYVYADAQGNLQFAESLDEIPANLRREAKRLEH